MNLCSLRVRFILEIVQRIGRFFSRGAIVASFCWTESSIAVKRGLHPDLRWMKPIGGARHGKLSGRVWLKVERAPSVAR